MRNVPVERASDIATGLHLDTRTRLAVRVQALVSVCALALASSPSSMTAANVDAGSYAVGDECLCLTVPPEIGQRIQPTPVGGQSVLQICRALGQSPALRVIDGVPNHPTYADVQCGHGPVPRGETLAADCEEPGADADSCVARGPRWNLARIYDLGASRVVGEPSDARSDAVSREVPASAPSEAPSAIRRAPRDDRETSVGDVSTPITDAATRPDTRQQERAEGPSVRLARAPGTEPVVIVTRDAADSASAPTIAAAPPSTTAIPDADDISIATVSGRRRLGAIERADSYLALAAVGAADGGRGLSVEGSIAAHGGEAPLALQFRFGATGERRDARLGAGLRVRPTDAKRLSIALAAGLEFGADDTVSAASAAERTNDDTGLYLRAASGMDIGTRVSLSGGMEAVTLFEGGYHVFGAAFLRVLPTLGVFMRVQGGDVERAWIGLRYDR